MFTTKQSVYVQQYSINIVSMTNTYLYYHPLTHSELVFWITLLTVPHCSCFQGFISSLYVVEIMVFPWRNQQLKTEKGQLHLDLHPVYEDEEGKCYFRRQASLVQVFLMRPSFLVSRSLLFIRPQAGVARGAGRGFIFTNRVGGGGNRALSHHMYIHYRLNVSTVFRDALLWSRYLIRIYMYRYVIFFTVAFKTF